MVFYLASPGTGTPFTCTCNQSPSLQCAIQPHAGGPSIEVSSVLLKFWKWILKSNSLFRRQPHLCWGINWYCQVCLSLAHEKISTSTGHRVECVEWMHKSMNKWMNESVSQWLGRSYHFGIYSEVGLATKARDRATSLLHWNYPSPFGHLLFFFSCWSSKTKTPLSALSLLPTLPSRHTFLISELA